MVLDILALTVKTFLAFVITAPALWIYHSTERIYTRRLSFFAPPGWLIGIVWMILYCTITISTIYFVNAAPAVGTPVGGNYLTTWIVLAVNILLNHAWMPLFFDRAAPWFALVDIAAVWGTAVTLLILNGIAARWTVFWWLLAYPIWLTYATILNVYWAIHSPESAKMRAHLLTD
jgi:tryptophan-rich sensory protein